MLFLFFIITDYYKFLWRGIIKFRFEIQVTIQSGYKFQKYKYQMAGWNLQ